MFSYYKMARPSHCYVKYFFIIIIIFSFWSCKRPKHCIRVPYYGFHFQLNSLSFLFCTVDKWNISYFFINFNFFFFLVFYLILLVPFAESFRIKYVPPLYSVCKIKMLLNILFFVTVINKFLIRHSDVSLFSLEKISHVLF